MKDIKRAIAIVLIVVFFNAPLKGTGAEPSRSDFADIYYSWLSQDLGRQSAKRALDHTLPRNQGVTPDQLLSREDLFTKLDRAELTLILFPGAFSEFITTRLFEETFNDNSLFQRAWDRAYRTSGSLVSTDSKVTTPFWDEAMSANLGYKMPVPLKELFSVTSIDYKDNPVIKIILLKSPPMSLESIGDLEETSKIYLRRLNKFFKILGQEPKNVVLLGYSRGTTTALDLLAHAPQVGWVEKVRAFVSLAGVIHGSTLADLSFYPPRSAKNFRNHRHLLLVDKLLEDLEETPQGLFGSTSQRIANYSILKTFLSEILKDQPSIEVNWSQDSLDRQALSSLIQMAALIALKGVDETNDHFQRVAAIKATLREVRLGLEQLTSTGRDGWWSTHTLPPSVQYYSISASMFDALRPPPLWNQYSYNSDSVDLSMLYTSYRDIADGAGAPYNDSQVTTKDATFLVERVLNLNPEQLPFRAIDLGTVNTHHWGIALKSVSAENPFPRRALLMSLLTAVAQDL
jgi:pimeloyl-ACP methyl ester carboxylesterase